MAEPWSTPDSWLTDYGSPSVPAVSKPSLLTSGWNEIEKFFGIAGKSTANTAGMTTDQAQAAKTSASLQNMGILMGVVGAANQAIGTFYAAKAKQYESKSASLTYGFQSDMAAINSRREEYAAQSTLEAGKSQVQQYTMAAGQEKASTTAEMAAHGVALGSGSARDVSASEDLVKDMDVLTINSNATRAAWDQRQAGAGLAGESLISRAASVSAAAGAKTISPFAGFAGSLLGSATQFASQWDYRRQLELKLGARQPYYGMATSAVGAGG